MEVYYNGEWGTVCDDGWDLDDAQVVCTQLGYDGATAALTRAYYGGGIGDIWLSNVDCDGTESTIGSCLHSGWGIHNAYCDHNKDAGVRCFSAVTTGMLCIYVHTHHSL